MAKTTFYVQIEPTFGRYNWDKDKLTGIKAKSVTQSRPTQAKGRSGSIVVKLTLDIPDAAFMPLAPEAVITVPSEMVSVPIDVAAIDPHQPAPTTDDYPPF